MPVISCTWDSNQMPKGHWKYKGNITQRKVVIFTSNIFAVYSSFSNYGSGATHWSSVFQTAIN